MNPTLSPWLLMTSLAVTTTSKRLLPPATKLWQGNVFTPVCHSVHGGICHTPSPGQTPPRQTPSPGQTPPLAQCMLGYGQQAGGTHPTGMHSCIHIVSDFIHICTLIEFCWRMYSERVFLTHARHSRFCWLPCRTWTRFRCRTPSAPASSLLIGWYLNHSSPIWLPYPLVN